eukprot:TRINITY_DN2092_c0_g2_i1.p1 TRINITY_DN2092_c0_g2~~TRINITY_DN2092_c0_g2_i1.p1  ORF type:complete len:703 (-),score=157.25 TRINITY_DN2092_c0_g2_i1:76-2184(-)
MESSQFAILSTCNLNQWALDFKGNYERIKLSILQSKEKKARYRLGPELEICGYGCQDHFLENDTYLHCWTVIEWIIKDKLSNDIICDVGMPVLHKGVRYNCRVFILNGKLLLIRPKMFLANDGNYRETRYFNAWCFPRKIAQHDLPANIKKLTGQDQVAFGDAALNLNDTVLSSETCEELFTPNSPHIYHTLNGIEIITNGSGSHHQLRKLNTRVDLIQNATAKCGGAYLYANQQGCDGDRLYFDGSCMIFANGKMLAQGSQFSLLDVEVTTATIDLEQIRSYRASIASRGTQAALSETVPRIYVDFDICDENAVPSYPIKPKFLLPEEEIAFGPACWLWDYLRRSGMGGYFLPLSGGADSSATATIVGSMCQLIFKEIKKGNSVILGDLRRVARLPNYDPLDPRDIASKIFVTAFLATKNSSTETSERAFNLSSEIGSVHYNINIDRIVDSFIEVSKSTFKHEPKFKVHGGSHSENLALQNIQARSRMVISYVVSQLYHSRDSGISLLVLGSANVDEALRGYYTKYDCSSADVNPIGSISKTDLKNFLLWASDNLGYKTLTSVANATPTAELEPLKEGQISQTDEVDMGMSYAELSIFGKLRSDSKCGPLSMFRYLCHKWDHLPLETVAHKVKHFFRCYGINRHKMTTLTPSYHCESYSPDDNRYDHRPFLYNSVWDLQFEEIDKIVLGKKSSAPVFKSNL